MESSCQKCLSVSKNNYLTRLRALNTHKRQVYRILKKLQNKEIVNATSCLPAKFYAVPLEKVLDLFMKVATEQTKALRASRKELVSTWRSMIEKDSSNN